MKSTSLVMCIAAAMALCACSTTGSSLVQNEKPAPVSGFTPIAIAMPSSGFCQGAAASDRQRAEISGFDAATLDRIALQSLQQCRALLAGSYNSSFERLASR
jgi:hypothetical protein